MYVRFVYATESGRRKSKLGVVASLRYMKETGQLSTWDEKHVEEIFAWLEDHLPCPPFMRKKWPPDAVCWFKDSAREMILKFREINAIIEQAGYPVQMITTDRPGMILYEDKFQVVARSKQF